MTPPPSPESRLVPLKREAARAFVDEHHRHNRPPIGDMFRVGLEQCGELVGVAIAGRPVARLLDDGHTVEVTRVCTTGARNANSKLYGAIARAAKALGYSRLITYTLQSESGASLRAAGFVEDARRGARDNWDTPVRRRSGDTPQAAKIRWLRLLASPESPRED